MIGDDKAPLYGKVTSIGFIVYVVSNLVRYFPQTAAFVYKIVGNVRHIVTAGIVDNLVRMFTQFLQTAVIAEQLRKLVLYILW